MIEPSLFAPPVGRLIYMTRPVMFPSQHKWLTLMVSGSRCVYAGDYTATIQREMFSGEFRLDQPYAWDRLGPTRVGPNYAMLERYLTRFGMDIIEHSRIHGSSYIDIEEDEFGCGNPACRSRSQRGRAVFVGGTWDIPAAFQTFEHLAENYAVRVQGRYAVRNDSTQRQMRFRLENTSSTDVAF